MISVAKAPNYHNHVYMNIVHFHSKNFPQQLWEFNTTFSLQASIQMMDHNPAGSSTPESGKTVCLQTFSL